MNDPPSVAYLVPGVGLDGAELDRRERIANDLTVGEVSVLDVDSGPLTVESAVEEAWAAVAALIRADEIESEFDALVIGCFGDPGLRPLRELLEIPVVGPAQSTFYTAAQLADRFGWLTILDSTIPVTHEQAREYGLADRCVSVRSVDAPVSSIDHEADELVDRMIHTGRLAIEEDGAAALFPGCMSLSFAQRHREIEAELDVPFLDPARIALEQATVWARHGLSASSRSYPEPSREKLGELLG